MGVWQLARRLAPRRRTRRAAGGKAPLPPCRDPGGQGGEADGEAAQVPPYQDDQRPGQPVPAAAARGDGPAQPVDDAGETLGRGGWEGGGHDSFTNTSGRGLGKRNFPPAVRGSVRRLPRVVGRKTVYPQMTQIAQMVQQQ